MWERPQARGIIAISLETGFLPHYKQNKQNGRCGNAQEAVPRYNSLEHIDGGTAMLEMEHSQGAPYRGLPTRKPGGALLK